MLSSLDAWQQSSFATIPMAAWTVSVVFLCSLAIAQPAQHHRKAADTFCDELLEVISDLDADPSLQSGVVTSDERICNGVSECQDGLDESVQLCG